VWFHLPETYYKVNNSNASIESINSEQREAVTGMGLLKPEQNGLTSSVCSHPLYRNK
jgi:hypothetical protein